MIQGNSKMVIIDDRCSICGFSREGLGATSPKIASFQLHGQFSHDFSRLGLHLFQEKVNLWSWRRANMAPVLVGIATIQEVPTCAELKFFQKKYNFHMYYLILSFPLEPGYLDIRKHILHE